MLDDHRFCLCYVLATVGLLASRLLSLYEFDNVRINHNFRMDDLRRGSRWFCDCVEDDGMDFWWLLELDTLLCANSDTGMEVARR